MKARAVILLVLAIIGAAVWATLRSIDERHAPVSPTQFVPARWQTARLAPMHEAHVAKKQLACAECHDRGWTEPAGERSCSRCHEKQVARLHAGNATTATPCATCHAFAELPKVASCVSCHEKRTTVAASPALGQHGTERAECKTCHDVHEAPGVRAQSNACAACHDQVRVTHVPVTGDGGAAEVSKACTSCHAPHQPAAAAKACETCHADHRGAFAIAKHGACTTCHQPHRPQGGRTACASCHAKVHVLASERVPAHAECTSCHDPHDPKAKPSLTCAKCHGSVDAKHPVVDAGAGTGPCTTCHEMHPKTAPAPRAATCSSCHAQATTDRDFHAAGKVACTQCHAPHRFAQASPVGPSFCAGCHAQKVGETTGHGHANCTQCHGAAHAPSTKVQCASCHREEARTAPAGHVACGSCHETHSGALGNHAACTSCHENKRAERGALHTNLKGGCASCHRPHGPSGVAAPPSCATCHDKAKLPGLHARPSHAKCDSCHGGHGPPRSDRATCTGACHADKRSHQLDATSCKGCHLFRD